MTKIISYKDSTPPPAGNYSMAFDGVNQRFQVFNPDQISGVISFSGWFKTSAAKNQTIVAFDGGPGRVAVFPFHVYLDSGGHLNFVIGHPNFRVSVATSVNGGYNNDEWHHFACLFDNGSSRTSLRLYVDNSAVGFSPARGIGIIQFQPPVAFSMSIGMIGQQPPITSFQWFDGLIDEIAIWDGHVLTTTEIADIYSAGADMDLLPLSPKYWWRMGENASFAGTIWRVPDEIGPFEMVSENMNFENRKIDVPD